MVCPLDRWTRRDSGTRQDSGTSLVSEGGMSNGRPVDVHWTGGLDGTVGQAWSVRVGCPMNSHGRPLDRWDNPKWTEDFDGKLGHEWSHHP